MVQQRNAIDEEAMPFILIYLDSKVVSCSFLYLVWYALDSYVIW